MGLLSKLKFWSKSEDEIGDLNLDDLGLPGENSAPGTDDLGLPKDSMPGAESSAIPGVPGQHRQPPKKPDTTTVSADMGPDMPPGTLSPTPSAPQPQTPRPSAPREMELVNAKLDTIRANLESINQRLANLERIARGDHEKPW